MNTEKTKPVIIGAIIGTLVGSLLGVIIANRRSQGARANYDFKEVTSIGFTSIALGKQIIDMFSHHQG